MVKNLPTIERSTKIRFGRNTLDDQAENTIVFNASNTAIQANTPGAVYLSPIRLKPEYDDPNIVLLMYNKETHEITESGEAATDIIETNLNGATFRGNVINVSTVYFDNTAHASFITDGNVGIVNTNPQHTLSIGSNVYVDDTASNVLVVSGGVSIDGNLVVNGGVTTITTENLKIGDAIIELGKNNTSDDTTLDLGLIMTRPTSNVTVGFREGSDELVMAYTESSADSNTITPLTSESLDVHVYGRVLTEANVGILNTSPIHTLDVGSNLYVDEFGSNILVVTGNTNITGDLTVDTDTLFVDTSTNSVGIETTEPKANLHVVGNVYVSSNLTVDTETLHVDAEASHVGVNTKEPKANLHVVGNVYISSNLTVDTETLHVDAEASHVGVNTKEPKANLHVVGNVYVSSNLTVDTETLHVDAEASHVGVNTKEPNANLHVVGNVYVSSNLTVDTETLHVDAEASHVGVNTKEPKANLHVVGNVYVSSNLTVDTETLHVDAEASHVGVNTKNPKANLHVVGNVYVSSNLTVDTDTLHVDAINKRVGIETKNPTSNLHVVGNVYVTSNVTTDGTLTLNHPTTALLTDLTSNVEVKLNQLANVVIDTATLAIEDMLVYDGSNWTNQLQNHTFLYAKAEETISKGDAVYATGSIGNNMFSIRKARANSSATMPALGLAYQAFALNDEGLIVTFGRADGVNTDDFQVGETVYVSAATAGALSNVKPYGATDLIQNIGLVVKAGENSGIVSVTGVGRSNDIPNAPIVADETDINYVYVNDTNNDLKKILPTNLLTQLQTLQQVTDTGNTTSNTIQFTNATTGLVTTSNLQVGSNISVAGLVDATHKHVPMVGLDGFLEKSPIYFTTGGKYVVTAAEAEFLGNLTLSGNTVILSSNNVTIEDRIFGVAANNSADQLDSGFMIEHQDEGAYANIALIYHADEHRFSISHTQNTFTDNHILHYDDPSGLIIDLRGNVQVQNSTTLSDTLDVTGAATFANDLTVGAVSNLFVDVSASRVGINEASPTTTLDVNGNARVQDTTDAVTKTTGALVVSGGLGVASNIHSTNVYAGSHVGVGTDAASAPLHILVSGTGETTNGIYMKSAAGSSTNDAIVNLEVASDGGDAFMTWNASGGAAFAMGLDRSESLLTIANSSSSLTTNARLRMATDGAVTLTNTTDATSTTDGSLIISGGLGVAKSIHAVTIRGTNLYGTLAGANTAAVTDLTATGTVEGATLAGTNLYGTLTGANTAAVTDLTATGTVEGATITGTNVYGTLTGANTAAVTDLTATGTVEGATITGTNVYGTLAGANTAAVTDLTATGTVEGATITGTNVYGTLTGANTAAVSDLTATGTVEGATITGTNVYGSLVGANTAAVTTLSASGVVNLTDETDATSSITGALQAAGGVGIAKDLYVGERAYVTGGLVTNTGGVTKKTYSHTGTITTGTTPGIDIVFSDHAFSAKITAQLIESDIEISTLMIDVTGGRRGGASVSTLNIAKGPLSIFGDVTSNPWSSTVSTTATTVTITPSTNLDGEGHYNIFVEYVSGDTSGSVSTIGGTSTGY
jgi:hypothetical protein